MTNRSHRLLAILLSVWMLTSTAVAASVPAGMNDGAAVLTTEVQSWPVTYFANGGTGVPAKQEKLAGKKLKLRTMTPRRQVALYLNANGGVCEEKKRMLPFPFLEWNTQRDGSGVSYAPGGTYTSDSSVSLCAQWGDPKPGDLPVPTRSGYRFSGWYTDRTGGEPVTAETTILKAATAYAHWDKAPTWSVFYYNNGGSGAPGKEIAPAVVSSKAPVRSVKLYFGVNGGQKLDAKSVQLAFLGWNTSADGSGSAYQPGQQITGPSSLKLYAQWGSGTVGTLPTPVRDGYVFTGWYTERTAGKKVSQSLQISQSTSLYAHWTKAAAPRTYQVTYYNNGGAGAPGVQKKQTGESLQLSRTEPTRSYLVTFRAGAGASPESRKVSAPFLGWNTKKDGSGTTYAPGSVYAEDASLILYAQWGSPSVGTLPQPERENCVFQGWYTSAGTQAADNMRLTENLTLSAQWIDHYGYPIVDLTVDKLYLERFQPAGPTDYRILWNGVTCELLVHSVPGSDRMIAVGTGAADRTQLPYYKNHEWVSDLSVTTVWYADPTLHENTLTLCWYYGNTDRWYLEEIAFLLAYISYRQDLSPEDIFFYGSSGGGYASMILGGLLHGNVFAVNPQLILSNYHASYYDRFLRTAVGTGTTPPEERIHVAKLYQRERFLPQARLLQNTVSEDDVRKQRDEFLSELSGICTDWDRLITTSEYSKGKPETAHNSLPAKTELLDQIDLELSKAPGGRALASDLTGTFYGRLLQTDLAGPNAWKSF